MLTPRQQQPALQQLRFRLMLLHFGLLAIGHQSCQRREVVFLVEIEQHITVVRILNCDASLISRIRRRQPAAKNQTECDKRTRLVKQTAAASEHALLPDPRVELGLQLLRLITDLQFDEFGANAFIEIQRRAAPVIPIMRTLAREESHQLMLPDLEIAQINPLDTAAMESIDLTLGIQIIRDLFAVELYLDRVERKKFADIDRQENCNLRVRGIQQLLLEHKEFAIQIKNRAFQRLGVLIQRRNCGLRPGIHSSGKPQQSGGATGQQSFACMFDVHESVPLSRQPGSVLNPLYSASSSSS